MYRALYCTYIGVSCLNPGMPSYGAMQPNLPTYSIGQKVTYVCSDGYEIHGESQQRCEDDGKFSDRVPKCIKR